jgi:hypothetical protein
MYGKKPFEMSNFSQIPNQLFDTRSTFLTNQQKIFLIFLYRRLYGDGKTEIQLSYSAVFEDIPCIIKNKQKFSNMINDLASKGLIKIIRGHKKCHTYIIKEEHYKKLIFFGERSKNKDYTEIQKDIKNGINEFNINDNDFSNFDINENTIETLKSIYQYEYKKIYPKKKYRFTKDDEEYFCLLKNELDNILDIHYATFIRCFFLDYYDDDYKPQVNKLYDLGLINYQQYKDIIIKTPIDDDAMKYLFVYVYNGYLLLKNKTIEEYIKKNEFYCAFDRVSPPHLFYCSKKYIEFCKEIKIDDRNDIIEKIKKYPAIVEFVNNILKEDSIFMEVKNE